MRIFCQMSVGGFKLFDIEAFAHQHDQFRYATMSDIANGAESRTHLIASDMHGMRMEICRLFSRGDVDLLLQNDVLENVPTTILYIDSCGITRDSMERECKVSFCFMSETDTDVEWLKKLAVCMALTGDSVVKEMLTRLVTIQILDDKQVLAYNESIMEALRHHVDEEYTDLATTVFTNCSQLVGLHDGVAPHKAVVNLKGLFNDEPYFAADMSNLKMYGRMQQLPEPIYMNHLILPKGHGTKRGDSRVHDFLTKLLNSFNKLDADLNNPKSD